MFENLPKIFQFISEMLRPNFYNFNVEAVIKFR